LTVVARTLILAAAISALAAATGCDGNDETIATVGGAKITRERMQGILEHAKEEAAREGHGFPKRGTAEHRNLERQAVALLVYHEELEQRAAALGVRVSDEEVERRAKLASENEDDEGEGADFAEESARASLLYRGVYDRLGKKVHVSGAQIVRFYRSHRGRYGARTLPDVRDEIRKTLLDEGRNAAMARWIAAMRRELDPKVTYAEGFGPPPSGP
jgi:hypothetical protein